MKILAFGASTSKKSINQQLASYTAQQFKDHDIEIIQLIDYQAPIYSIDYEDEIGIPAQIVALYEKISQADITIISLAEHNGSYTAAFKNTMDWLSRHESKFFAHTKLILLSTSPGARGGMSVMQAAQTRFPSHGANIVASFSLPKFEENFSASEGVLDEKLKEEFEKIIHNQGSY
jgi:chromate reductase, NAD(P)H dehydrogenase (quinone)